MDINETLSWMANTWHLKKNRLRLKLKRREHSVQLHRHRLTYMKFSWNPQQSQRLSLKSNQQLNWKYRGQNETKASKTSLDQDCCWWLISPSKIMAISPLSCPAKSPTSVILAILWECRVKRSVKKHTQLAEVPVVSLDYHFTLLSHKWGDPYIGNMWKLSIKYNESAWMILLSYIIQISVPH